MISSVHRGNNDTLCDISTFELPCDKRYQHMCYVFRYSLWYLNYLRKRETRTSVIFRNSHWHSNYLPTGGMRMCMTSSGMLIDIWITSRQKIRCHVLFLQIFCSTFELPYDKGNEDVYDIFSYCHRQSNYLTTKETKMCLRPSGILINLRIAILQGELQLS